MAAAVVAISAAAVSFADTGSSLPGSPFNGTDGTLDTVFPAGVPTPVVFNDLPSGKDDDALGQGTKEDDTTVNVVNGSIPPNKNDLTQFGIDVGTATVGSDTHTYLYLDWFRAVNTGNANLDFEFNQNSFGIPTTATKDVPLNRTANDLLVLYDFGGSGTPVISISRWITSGACAVGSDSPPCWGTVQTLAANSAEGSVSADGLFGEATIDLTAAGIVGPTQCFAAHQAWAKARSSTSLNAEMKDIISPGPININTCQPASVTVTKQDTSNPPAPLTGAVFQLFKETDGVAGLSAGDTQVGGNLTVTNANGTVTFSNITDSGTYYVKELTAPADYALPAQSVKTVNIVISNSATNYPVTFNDPPLYKIVVFTCNNATQAPVVGSVSLTGGSLGGAAVKDTDALLGSGGTPSLAQQVCANAYSGSATTNGSGASFPDLAAGTYSASIQDPKQ